MNRYFKLVENVGGELTTGGNAKPQQVAVPQSAPFELIMRQNTLLPADDAAVDQTTVVSDGAKMRAAMNASPLESLDALSRLIGLQKQETAAVAAEAEANKPRAWFQDDMPTIATKSLNASSDALRDIWALKFITVDKLIADISAIVVKDSRLPYILLVGIVLLILLRASSHSDPK